MERVGVKKLKIGRGLSYNKACLIAESQIIIQQKFKGYPFTRPLNRFRVKDLKKFISLYENKGGK